MKKQFIRLAALVMCAIMCISLAACGDKKTGDQDQNPSNSQVGNEDENQNPGNAGAGNANDGQEGATLTEYLDGMRDEIEAQIEEMGDQMNLAVEADGNKLVYTYQYNLDIVETMGVDAATVKDLLDEQMEAAVSDFHDILTALQEDVPSAEAIVVRYLDKDGNEITSMEFN